MTFRPKWNSETNRAGIKTDATVHNVEKLIRVDIGRSCNGQIVRDFLDPPPWKKAKFDMRTARSGQCLGQIGDAERGIERKCARV